MRRFVGPLNVSKAIFCFHLHQTINLVLLLLHSLFSPHQHLMSGSHQGGTALAFLRTLQDEIEEEKRQKQATKAPRLIGRADGSRSGTRVSVEDFQDAAEEFADNFGLDDEDWRICHDQKTAELMVSPDSQQADMMFGYIQRSSHLKVLNMR